MCAVTLLAEPAPLTNACLVALAGSRRSRHGGIATVGGETALAAERIFATALHVLPLTSPREGDASTGLFRGHDRAARESRRKLATRALGAFVTFAGAMRHPSAAIGIITLARHRARDAAWLRPAVLRLAFARGHLPLADALIGDAERRRRRQRVRRSVKDSACWLRAFTGARRASFAVGGAIVCPLTPSGHRLAENVVVDVAARKSRRNRPAFGLAGAGHTRVGFAGVRRR